jgi:hypothetical protein
MPVAWSTAAAPSRRAILWLAAPGSAPTIQSPDSALSLTEALVLASPGKAIGGARREETAPGGGAPAADDAVPDPGDAAKSSTSSKDSTSSGSACLVAPDTSPILIFFTNQPCLVWICLESL